MIFKEILWTDDSEYPGTITTVDLEKNTFEKNGPVFPKYS